MPDMETVARIMALENKIEQIKTLEFMSRDAPGVGITRAVSSFLSLPGLRCYWPLNVTGDDVVKDLSGNGIDLTPEGTTGLPEITIDSGSLINYMSFTAANEHRLFAADVNALDITGTETYLSSTLRGFTFGTWAKFNNTGVTEYLVNKQVITGDQRSFSFSKNTSDQLNPAVWQSGTSTPNSAVVGTNTISMDTWAFFVIRLDPSVTFDVLFAYATDETFTIESDTSSVVTQVYASTAPLHLGSWYNGVSTFNHLNGAMAHAFLCASFLPDNVLYHLFRITKAMFL